MCLCSLLKLSSAVFHSLVKLLAKLHCGSLKPTVTHVVCFSPYETLLLQWIVSTVAQYPCLQGEGEGEGERERERVL